MRLLESRVSPPLPARILTQRKLQRVARPKSLDELFITQLCNTQGRVCGLLARARGERAQQQREQQQQTGGSGFHFGGKPALRFRFSSDILAERNAREKNECVCVCT